MVDINIESVWPKYGLTETPFSTEPLRLFGTLPIQKVFAGREKEIQELGRRINSSRSTRSLIVGEPGVGKTTYGNYVRWLLCRKTPKNSIFVTPPVEIKFQNTWNAQQFLKSTLSAILNANTVFDWKNNGLEINTLKELDQYIVSKKHLGVGVSASVLGSGIGGQYVPTLTLPTDISIEILEDFFIKILREIRDQGKSLVIQYNNLETVENDNLASLLISIRDYLQIDGLHTIFLGPPESISSFEKYPQVRSVFSNPILLDELDVDRVIEILKKRCEALKLEDGQYIPPYEEESINFLHRMLNGNIRFIFMVLNDTITFLANEAPCSIRIKDIQYYGIDQSKKQIDHLSENERKVLFALYEKKELSVTDLSKETKISVQNLSTNELRSLKDKGYIATFKNADDRRYTLVRLSQVTELIIKCSTEKIGDCKDSQTQLKS